MQTWITSAAGSGFSIHNLPFGVFTTAQRNHRAGIAIGHQIVDLCELAQQGLFADLGFDSWTLNQPHLNAFIALGKAVTGRVRTRVQAWLCDPQSPLALHPDALVPMADARMLLPVRIGDYTDFYASIEHATNVGKMFRDPENALLPNWRHLPVGYHGRASSIVVSGTPVRRPMGQVMPKGEATPVFQASARLDFELEMAFIIGQENPLGQPITAAQAADYIFGMVLFNDWSARDIQQWEYVPLGPFLGKNFASSMSPWVVVLEALEPFRVPGPEQVPAVLPYLRTDGNQNYDIDLEVVIRTPNGDDNTVSRSNFRHMYWNMAQQLAHHTVGGCNMRVGDVLASGTISGASEDSFGSMLELAWAGTRPLPMRDGTTRTFIHDGDTVVLRGHATRGDIHIGFGEVSAQVLPAIT